MRSLVMMSPGLPNMMIYSHILTILMLTGLAITPLDQIRKSMLEEPPIIIMHQRSSMLRRFLIKTLTQKQLKQLFKPTGTCLT